MKYVTFEAAELENVIIENTNFLQVTFKNAKIKNSVILGNMNKVDFEGATFDNVYINGKRVECEEEVKKFSADVDHFLHYTGRYKN